MAKKRSPNYPAYDLGAALDFVRRVYREEGTTSATADVVATALGYNSLSGSARQKIASMRQYGLIESAPGGKIQVSKAGVRLSHDPESSENRALIGEAALTPSLFRELYEKYPDASNRNLEVRLINDKGFLPEGARQVIKSYRATMAFAKVGEGGYTGDSTGANADDGLDSEDNDEGRDQRRDQRRRVEASDVTFSWPLEDAEKVELVFIGNKGKKPSRRDLDALIDYLELIKKRTPEIDPASLSDIISRTQESFKSGE